MNVVGQLVTHTCAGFDSGALQSVVKGLSLKRLSGKVLKLVGITVAGIALSTTAWAACSLDQFKPLVLSTGTGPFNSADTCRANDPLTGTGAGTAHTPGNDACEGDLVVRTNDTYIYRFNYRVLAGQVENNVTFVSTLPLVGGRKVTVWDGLPPQCTGAGSGISADGLTLTCNIGTIDRSQPGANGASAGAVLAQVKATVFGADNDPVANVTTKVTTDACTTADNPPASPPTVSISARQKTDFRKDTAYGQQAYTFNGVPGYLVGYYLYMDQFDPTGASSRGGQSLNSPIVLNDVTSSNWPAGSKWFDCFRADDYQGNISCPAQGTPVAGGATLPITITAQSGEEGEFMVAGGKNTAIGRDPNASNPARLATYVVRVFVPLASIQAAGGQLNLENAIPASQIVGQDLAGQPIVDVKPDNNQLSQTVVATLPGGVYKYVANEWGYNWSGATPGAPGTQYKQMQGTDNYGDSGTGLTFPNQYFYPRLDYYNPNINPATNIILCDSFNSAEVRVAEISSIPGQGAADIYATGSTFGQVEGGRYPKGYKIGYGVSSGLAAAGAASRCADGDVPVWYPSLTAAAAAGDREKINKVRMVIPELGSGEQAYFMVAHQSRPNVNGTIVDDYMSAIGSNLGGNEGAGGPGTWLLSGYDPVSNNGVGLGKRFKLTTALARIQKEAGLTATGPNINQATAGGSVTYKLSPSISSPITSPPPTYITIVDFLPEPLTYIDGSASRVPDSVQTGAGGTTITWTINNVTPNVPLPTLTFAALVPETIPPNSSRVNNVEISTPDDTSDAVLRRATKPLTVLNPPGVKTVKSVAAPLIDPNGTAVWKIQVSNFENAPATLDVIDVLPFVGDGAANGAIQGRVPATTFVGTRGLVVAPVSVAGGTLRYTNASPAVLTQGANAKQDPNAPSNTPTPGDGWCLATEFGTGSCPANFAAVTAFRVTGIPAGANSTIDINFETPTNANAVDNVYTNRFFVKPVGLLGTLQSNDVKVTVKLGSIAGTVYFDSDKTATKNLPADVGIGGVTVTLCKLPPVAGACPAGGAVVNPQTGVVIAPAITKPDGTYLFSGVPASPAGGYFVIETPPADFGTGPTNAAGSLGGTPTPNNFAAIKLPVGANGTNYNFGHVATDLNTTVVVPTAPVVPGSIVNATVKFGNNSTTDGENTTATITLSPGLSNVNVNLPGWTATAYNPTTGVVTLTPVAPGGKFPAGANVVAAVSFTAPTTGTVTITSSITNTVADINPLPFTDPNATPLNRNTHQGVISVIPMVIDVRKRAGTPRQTTGANIAAEDLAFGFAAPTEAYVIPYRVIVSNKGAITATNVQLTDRLDLTFPTGVVVGVFQGNTALSPASPAGPVLVAGSDPSCVLASPAFNGVGQPNMLNGSVNLPPLVGTNPNAAPSCILEFSVVVRFPSAAVVPKTAQKNTAFASANNSPNNPGPTSFTGGVPVYGPGTRATDASTDTPQVPPTPAGAYPDAPTPGGSAANTDAPDPTPVLLGDPQQIDVQKSASTPQQMDTSGRRFRIAYTVLLQNSSASATATNVQLSENLKFTFPTAVSFQRIGGITQVGPCTVNAAYDGGNSNAPASYNLFGPGGVSSDNIPPSGSCAVSFAIEVIYPAAGVPTTPPQNRAFGSTNLTANAGPPFDATGTKSGDNVNLIAKDTSANFTPLVDTLGATPPAAPPLLTAPKSDQGSGTPAIIRTLETVKAIRAAVRTLSPTKFLVPYKVTVAAIGTTGAVLPNVQALDNLKQTFDRDGNNVPTITVIPGSRALASGPAACGNLGTFTGISAAGNALLPGNTSLTVGDTCVFNFDVEVDYLTAAAVEKGPHQNTVFASSVPGAGPNTGGTVATTVGTVTSIASAGLTTGTAAGNWTPPVGALAIDASTDNAPIPGTPAADNPLPTPVTFVPAAPLSAIKYVENLTVPRAVPVKGNDIQWTIVYKNEGTASLNSVMISDTLNANLTNGMVVSVQLTPPPPSGSGGLQPIPNAAYNGVGVVDTLGNPILLQPGQFITVKIKATILASASGSITNQASLSATEYGGPSGTKVPTSAINPGAPACPNTNACVPTGVTVSPEAIPSHPTAGPNGGKDQPNVLAVLQGGSISGIAWLDATKNNIIDGGEPRVPGLKVIVYAIDPVTGVRLKEVTNPVNRPVTDANGAYSVGNLPPSSPSVEYEVVFQNEAGDAILGTPVPQATGASAANNGSVPPTKDKITRIKVVAGQETPQQNLPLDPSGVVYDSITRNPVPGAVVAFTGPPGFNPAIHLVGGASNASQTTGPSGLYQFLLLPGAPAGNYSIAVTPPGAYVNSTLIPPQPGAFPSAPPAGGVNPVVPNPRAPQLAAGDPTTYYLTFQLNPGTSADVVHNHIPLDPKTQPKIAVSKVVNKPVAELGDSVLYTVKVRNIGQSVLPAGAIITDRLPAGFRYILGTSMTTNPGAASFLSVADPAGGVGATLVYTTLVSIPVNAELVYTYRVRLGVGSMQGDGVNRVQAKFGTVTSNEARAKVVVEPGVFTNEGCVAGKVFVDCNNNHIQDAEELGVPGVRLYMEDGTYFVTDSEGKYSYCGISPKSHVISVDMLTMPRGSRMTTTSNRNLGDGNSIFLDVKNGQIIRADFAEGSCSNTTLEQVKARRTQGEVRSTETEKTGQPALKFEGKSPQYPQQGTDGANQPLVVPRPKNGGSESVPEQNTPVPKIPGASSNTQGANVRDAK